MLSFFPRDVLDEIFNLIESVSEVFLPTLPMRLEQTKQRYVASYNSGLLPTELSGQNKNQEEYK